MPPVTDFSPVEIAEMWANAVRRQEDRHQRILRPFLRACRALMEYERTLNNGDLAEATEAANEAMANWEASQERDAVREMRGAGVQAGGGEC